MKLIRFLGMRGGAKVIIQPHRLEGIYVAKGQQDALVTKSFYPGESVYNEKRISIQVFLMVWSHY